MLFLITEILVSLLVAAALGALVAWLAKDQLARRERLRLERLLRDSESRAGTFKNQLTEANLTEDNLRTRLRDLEETAASRPPAAGAEAETIAKLEADLAARDKKIQILELQVSQSEAALTSEWQSLKALKTEVAERQQRLDARGKERDSRLKESEEAQRRLREKIVALEQQLSGLREASEQTLGDERRRTSARDRELEKARAELAERDAIVARLKDTLKRAQTAAGPPDEEDDLEELRGIGPVLHRKLNDAGVLAFRQIASWSEDDVERVAARVGASAGRIRRDRWVEQAGELLRAKEG